MAGEDTGGDSLLMEDAAGETKKKKKVGSVKVCKK